MLSTHPSICTRSEPWLLLGLMSVLRDDGIHADFDWPIFRQGVRDFEQALPRGRTQLVRALGEAYASLASSIRHAEGKRLYLDKTPPYHLIAPLIAEAFPAAHFIVLRRNPIGVLTSLIATWVADDWRRLAVHRVALTDGPRNVARFASQRPDVLSLRFEDIVASPRRALDVMCDHLGLDPGQASVRYAEGPSLPWALGDQGLAFSLQEPDPNAAERWQTRVTASPQVWRCAYEYLDLLGDELVASLGYDSTLVREQLASLKPTSVAGTRSLTDLLEA